mmetsp:Transcript_14170/g.26659  ORF Transcript_14170/g.26659 Transcript_14170/m.26659 type:complete len:287 (-) Transcript_14170:42-902(-)
MPDKKVTITVPSYRSSALGFTEYAIQVYVYTGETYVVFKRYSDLLKISTSLSSITKTLGIELPEFPPKQLKAKSPAVIQRRQGMLEEWLQEVFNNPPLLTYAISPLDLPEYLVFLVESQTGSSHCCNLNDAEMLVLSFIEFISSSECERGHVVKSFRKALLSSVSNLCKDVFCLLLRFLMHMITDPELSMHAIKFLLKLMLHDKYSDPCITELLELDIELLRAIELNRHLVQEMPKVNASVFDILCLLKQRLSKQMRSNLLVNILNEDSYAIGVFMQEYRERFVYL